MTLQEIEKKLEDTRAAIVFAERILQKMPEGSLYTRYQYNGIRYYQRFKGDTEGHYLGKDKKETIGLLEEKAYYSELLRVARQEEKDLLTLKRTLESIPDYNSVFLNIAEEKRHLIVPYENRAQNEDEELVRLFNRKSVPENLKLKTQKGEYVRSKSEVIIADRLRASGIPYIYEDPLILAGNVKVGPLYLHPDFKVQNVRTGKQYYWEHFGMLDNPEYCKVFLERLERYAQYGYFPGENLIVTFESSRHELNLEYVDCLIERYLKL